MHREWRKFCRNKIDHIRVFEIPDARSLLEFGGLSPCYRERTTGKIPIVDEGPLYMPIAGNLFIVQCESQHVLRKPAKKATIGGCDIETNASSKCYRMQVPRISSCHSRLHLAKIVWSMPGEDFS